MKLKKIIKKLKSGKLNVEQALQELAEIGYCPALLNDDNGRWAVTFEGVQNVALDAPRDISASFFVKANKWRYIIHEALIVALEN